jgi:putative SOS response-associated peptidase YedK
VTAWLEPTCDDSDFLQSLLVPLSADVMQSVEVSPSINNAREDIDPRGFVKKRTTLF